MGLFRCACAVLGLLLTIRSSEESSEDVLCQHFDGGKCVTDTECPVNYIMKQISCGKGKVCCIKASDDEQCKSKGGNCVTHTDCPNEEDKATYISCGEEKVCCIKYDICKENGGKCSSFDCGPLRLDYSCSNGFYCCIWWK